SMASHKFQRVFRASELVYTALSFCIVQVQRFFISKKWLVPFRLSCTLSSIFVLLLSFPSISYSQSFDGNSGRYQIISRHSGKAMDVEGISSVNGANVILWDYLGGTNQQWDIAGLGNGYYSIRAAHSGKSL